MTSVTPTSDPTVTEPTATDPEPTEPRSRWRSKGRIALIAAIVLVPLLAWLAFGYFGVQFLFIDDKVDEANPFAAATPAQTDNETANTEAGRAEGSETEGSDAAPSEANGAASPVPAEVLTLTTGEFVGRAHPTSGSANVITDGSNSRFLRFEDFATDNGPDLNVYLAVDGDVDNGFVDLGNLKGNIGNQNYELDPGIDLDQYDTVVIWCVRFGVSFGDAALAAV